MKKLLIIPLLGLLLWGFIAVTQWASYKEFVWQSPVTFHKPLQIRKLEMLNPEVRLVEVPQEDNKIVLRVSHYNPDLGGVNCANFVDGECISNMANGESWKENIGIALACPKELEFGTKIKIKDRVWVCMDRGSRITKEGDVYWVDMLYPYALMPYGSVVIGEIVE